MLALEYVFMHEAVLLSKSARLISHLSRIQTFFSLLIIIHIVFRRPTNHDFSIIIGDQGPIFTRLESKFLETTRGTQSINSFLRDLLMRIGH